MTTSTTATAWSITGTYFESCNCDAACPCVFLSMPTQGDCTALIDVSDQDVRSGTSESLCQLTAKACTPARDEGDLLVDLHCTPR